MERVGSRGRDDGNLRSSRTALNVGPEGLVFHVELVDRFEGNRQPDVFALHLIENGCRVNPVESQVVVVKPVPGKADRSLVACPSVDSTRDERSQSRPVPSIDRQLVDLLLLDRTADCRVDAIQLKLCLGDVDLLLARADF